MKYFSNLPIINYANNFVRNIFTRVNFRHNFKQDNSAFYPYVQQESQGTQLRYENLAFDYYDDVDDVWILHLTNEVIDPYFDVALTQEDLDSYIVKKYGSLRKANQTVLFYRNNYDQDDRLLTQAAYGALPADTKRFWTPAVNFDNNIIGYQRLADAIVLSTNKLLSIDITLADANTTFIVNEKVTQTTSGAAGFVTFSNTSMVSVQHITGTFSNTSTYYITGETSLANASPSIVTTVSNNIPANQQTYFSAVTAYDYENEMNNKKKTITILDKRHQPYIHSLFRELVTE
jgi:hypothetical protein